MIDIEKIRAEFERRFPVPEGMQWMHWDTPTGQAGGYVVMCGSCCKGEHAAQYAARWESWEACRQSIQVANPFELIIGDPDGQWAHDVAEKSLRAQGFKVLG